MKKDSKEGAIENSEDLDSELYTEKKSLFRWGIHELVLILLLAISFFAFFNVLPSELDYLEKIISWTALGLLLYNARLSQIFFGEEHKFLDFFLILSYFGLIFKDLVEYSEMAIKSSSNSIFLSSYQFIADNRIFFDEYAFMAGCVVIIIISLYVALKVNFKIPSVMHIVHEEGSPSASLRKFIERFLLTNLVLFGFFIIVFNLLAEWLAIAGNNPLLIAGIIFYFSKGKKLTLGTKLEKLGSLGEDFYVEFIKLFQSENKIWFALSGMLVLHMFTDIVNFMIPYIFGLASTLYTKIGSAAGSAASGAAGSSGTLGHEVLYTLISVGFSQFPNVIDKIVLIGGYAFNTVAMLLLLFTPAYMWYKIYRKETFEMKGIIVFLFVSSIIYFIISPVFVIGKLENTNIVGTDIKSQMIQPNLMLFVLSILSGIVIALLSLIEFVKRGITLLIAILTELFFFEYIFYYFMSISGFYISSIALFFSSQNFFFLFSMCIFFGISCLFYIGSSVAFLIETWK